MATNPIAFSPSIHGGLRLTSAQIEASLERARLRRGLLPKAGDRAGLQLQRKMFEDSVRKLAAGGDR